MNVRQLWILGMMVLFLAAGTVCVSAQQISLKSNAAYLATATPNIAVEIGLSPRVTLEVGGGYNPFGSSDKSFKHFLVQPSLRWWMWRSFAGTFVGVHAHGGTYDVGGFGPLTSLKENNYDGWLVGAGVSIGRHWLLTDRWGVEAEIGFGYVRMQYDKKPYGEVEEPEWKKFKNNYFGPTRLNFSLVYYL